MNNRQHQRGFTLIEMMISMFIGLIILGGTITAYQTISDVREYRDNNDKLQDELMYIHRELSSTVKVAKSVKIGKSNNGNKLFLASSESAENGITCPGRGDKGKGKDVTWSIGDDGNEFVCQHGSNDPIIDLSSKGEVGIESVVFCSLPHKNKGKCDVGKSPKGVFVIINYYDRNCNLNDEGCNSKALSFYLATRNINDSDKPKENE